MLLRLDNSSCNKLTALLFGLFIALRPRSKDNNLDNCETCGGIFPENMLRERFKYLSLRKLTYLGRNLRVIEVIVRKIKISKVKKAEETAVCIHCTIDLAATKINVNHLNSSRSS
ncbi:hypothetical protein L195_g004944 [Trifolium pratense]|uniref:Uncharacterized protein n=1 Tax=Trifolium pratense TaxID=57577 RepID=A0A2K3NZF8_TRIPR|nr:hypothetical protein L195_g004944 [Trifolium pratense]